MAMKTHDRYSKWLRSKKGQSILYCKYV